MLADLDRARDALHAIPPDLPRDEWVRAGMAAHAAGLPFDEFDTITCQYSCLLYQLAGRPTPIA